MTQKVLQKTPSWADLVEFASKLTPEQLSQPIRWWGEEKGGTINGLHQLEEDYILDDMCYSPKSSYDAVTLAEVMEDYEGIMPAGTPIVYVD